MLVANKLPAEFKFNPHAPGFVDDPYPTYRIMRELHPVHYYRTFRSGQFMLSRYRDVKDALRSKSLVMDDLGHVVPDPRHMGVVAEDAAILRASYRGWLLFIDPPDHTRLRNLVRHDFAFSAMEKLRPFVDEQVDRIFDSCGRTGKMEVVSQLALPVPAATLSKVLGVENGRLPSLAARFKQIFGIFEQPLALSRYRLLVDAAKELRVAVMEEIDARRSSDAHDLLTAIARNEQMGSEDELVGFVYMLISTGLDTSEGFIANGVHALLANPAQFNLLCKSPELIENAALELARFDAPVQFVTRMAASEVEIAGQKIPAGSRIFLCMGSANHDEAQFENPERLDITRQQTGHLAFGAGIHFCLGREIALLQMKAVLRNLVKHPDARLEPHGAARKPDGIVIRGFQRLEVNLAPAGPA